MLLNRVTAVLALVLGVVGIAACLAGAYGVWRVQARLQQANDKVFGAVDRSLEVLQGRIPSVRQNVKKAKVTTAEVNAALTEWGAKLARDRLVSKLEIESRAGKVAEHLRTADLMLDASREAVRDVQQVLEVGQSLGVEVDPASLDAVLQRLASLRESLQQAERAVDGIRQFAEGDPAEERLAQVAKLSARILLTLSDVEERLDDFAARLTEVRAQAGLGNIRTSQYIELGAAVCFGLLAWMAAGQGALCWWGWSRFRRQSSEPQSVSSRS